jgi:hypothetical protein
MIACYLSKGDIRNRPYSVRGTAIVRRTDVRGVEREVQLNPIHACLAEAAKTLTFGVLRNELAYVFDRHMSSPSDARQCVLDARVRSSGVLGQREQDAQRGAERQRAGETPAQDERHR